MIRKFGIFKLKNIKFIRNNVCGKLAEFKLTKQIKFKPCTNFLREINGIEDTIFTHKRISTLLKALKIDTKNEIIIKK
jgi:predicted acetyltransferase